MSLRVRRMALGLAMLMLLASLFLVVRGFLNAPEALASCPERTWCDPPVVQDTPICCCQIGRNYAHVYQTCYWQEVDCTINSDTYEIGSGCFGNNFCWWC
jgi:hypothetical protein